VPRHIRNSALALLPVLMIPSLAACGGGSSSSSEATGSAAAEGLSQVSFTGDVGKSVTATWKSTVPLPKTSSVKTLVKGSGDKIASNDTVSAYIWIGDGTTKKNVYSDYQNGQAEPLPANGQMGPVFSKIFAGQTYGSRVVAVTDSTDLLGSATAGAQMGIGQNDSIVVVADLVKKAPTSPTPTDAKAHDVAPGKLPKVVETKGKPSGLDWKGVSKPALTTPVQRAVLKQGKGAKVKATDSVTVNYLGEVYDAKTPFDESYSKGKTLTSALDQLIQGWAIGLDGVRVGSRVLLQIPPAYGYGAQGSGSDIPANATLWFVIDVVKAKAAK